MAEISVTGAIAPIAQLMREQSPAKGTESVEHRPSFEGADYEPPQYPVSSSIGTIPTGYITGELPVQFDNKDITPWYKKFLQVLSQVKETIASVIFGKKPKTEIIPVPALQNMQQVENTRTTIAVLPKLMYVLALYNLSALVSYEALQTQEQNISYKIFADTERKIITVKAKLLAEVDENYALYVTCDGTILKLAKITTASNNAAMYEGEVVFAESYWENFAQFHTKIRTQVQYEVAQLLDINAKQIDMQKFILILANQLAQLAQLARKHTDFANAAKLYAAAARLSYQQPENAKRLFALQSLCNGFTATRTQSIKNSSARQIQTAWKQHKEYVKTRAAAANTANPNVDVAVVNHKKSAAQFAIDPNTMKAMRYDPKNFQALADTEVSGSFKQFRGAHAGTAYLQLNKTQGSLKRNMSPSEILNGINKAARAQSINVTDAVAPSYHIRNGNLIAQNAGISLYEYLRQRNDCRTISLDAFEQAVVTITTAHHGRIFHRDIKTSNICIKPEFDIKFTLNPGNIRSDSKSVFITPDVKQIIFHIDGKRYTIDLGTLGFDAKDIMEASNAAEIVQTVKRFLQQGCLTNAEKFAQLLPFATMSTTIIDWDFAQSGAELSGYCGTRGYTTCQLQNIIKDNSSSPDKKARAAQVSDYYGMLITVMITMYPPLQVIFDAANGYLDMVFQGNSGNPGGLKALLAQKATRHVSSSMSYILELFLNSLPEKYRETAKAIMLNPSNFAENTSPLPSLTELFYGKTLVEMANSQ